MGDRKMDASQRQPVLVLEDQVLIALYVEELLRQAGFKDVTSFPSCAAASDWLERNNPQLVIMETKLRDGSCDHLAALLMKRNIPFIVHSVEQDRAGDHEGLATKCRWFDKPCDPDDFMGAVRECTSVN